VTFDRKARETADFQRPADRSDVHAGVTFRLARRRPFERAVPRRGEESGGRAAAQPIGALAAHAGGPGRACHAAGAGEEGELAARRPAVAAGGLRGGSGLTHRPAWITKAVLQDRGLLQSPESAFDPFLPLATEQSAVPQTVKVFSARRRPNHRASLVTDDPA
jgi:hypothetical protein